MTTRAQPVRLEFDIRVRRHYQHVGDVRRSGLSLSAFLIDTVVALVELAAYLEHLGINYRVSVYSRIDCR